MAEETPGEKTFDPTPKRRSDAAKKGDVLRSKEVATLAATGTGALVLLGLGPWLADSMAATARAGFMFDRRALDGFAPGAAVADAALAILPPVMALGLAAALVTIVSQLLLGEGRFNPGNMAFKGSRINPLSGLKRIFGWQGLIELGKGLLKLALLGGIAWFWAAAHLPALLVLGRSPLEAQLGLAIGAITGLVGALLAGLAVIAMIDYPLQRFQQNKRLKMSLQDLRDENKQAEGSPEMKSARRQRQRDLSRGGVAKAMKDAQFVIVNPLHFAVALTYDPAIAPAPVVLAKGRGETALAMRELAGEGGLPVLEYPQLARAVYFTTQANQMVREELYVAIAALVAFVMALKRGQHPSRPLIDVPPELCFDGDGKVEARA
ncbi:EscU/YscU/HrcU family type III secretion system export apparatus switch protein [Erythrobacter sanguineus]|jgi:flagellar biosynthetic protein FlhB|uniref:Flagellar biosynthetic protein FlhB n=1 Tax=Erythrobacter sanguineus TaxID=198312 RepID=A0A1M7SYK6_9SPHN|nr:flagellar type III secretion system protein FlhB [Erythrobacter sanguineus]MCR9179346.1 flagellar type III secretion system protein FlhB [Erythrobacteraceae bacterium]SHN63474.1 flagellar biosynthetic protein FlhB [Erythrobacter sanguineus]